jgi:hypothetical protein
MLAEVRRFKSLRHLYLPTVMWAQCLSSFCRFRSCSHGLATIVAGPSTWKRNGDVSVELCPHSRLDIHYMPFQLPIITLQHVTIPSFVIGDTTSGCQDTTTPRRYDTATRRGSR